MIRLHLILLVMVAGLSASDSRSAERPQHNFLFVVDSSSSMSRHKPAAIKLLQEVIASRFEQQIEPGDSIDIWTYDTENNLHGFPPQIWQSTNSTAIAEAAASYLQKYPFKGRSDFSNVAGDLNLLIPQTKALLVIVITDGESPFAGINLDLDINEYLSKRGKLGPANDPFLISLAAINGSLRTWTAHFGKGQPDLATLPERSKPKTAIAEARPKPAVKPQGPAPKPQFGPIASPLVAAPPEAVINFPAGTRINPVATPLEKPLELSQAPEKVKPATEPKAQLTATNPVIDQQLAAKTPPPEKPHHIAANPPVRATNMALLPPKTNHALTAAPRTNMGKSLHFGKAAPTNTNTVASMVNSNRVTNTTLLASQTNRSSASAESNQLLAARVDAKPSNKNKQAVSPPNLNPTQAFRSAILLSGVTGAGCFLLGAYLVYRKLRRPTESIISRSLLQR